MFWIMSTRFGFNVEKEILNDDIGCVLLCKSVPVLTLDVLQISEESKTHIMLEGSPL